MASKAYWQCRVEGCKHPGRSFKSTDAMRRHLMDTHGVSNDCEDLRSCWPAEVVYWNDSDSEKEDKDEAPCRTTVTIGEGRSRSRSPVLDAAGAASRSYSLMQEVRQLPDNQLICCFLDMVEEMASRLLRRDFAGPAPAASSCGNGKRKRRKR